MEGLRGHEASLRSGSGILQEEEASLRARLDERGLAVVGGGTVHGVDLDLAHAGELAPTLAALAAINNDAFGCANPTGTLRLELWAVTTAKSGSIDVEPFRCTSKKSVSRCRMTTSDSPKGR